MRKRLVWLVFGLFFLIMVGCKNTNFDIDSSQGKTAQSIINRYYDNLSNPIDSNRSFSLVETTNKIGLTTVYGYLYSKGYRVIRKGEPIFIRYEEPYAIFQLDVQISYPNDSEITSSSLPISEMIWVDVRNFKIYKIKGKDKFTLTRVSNYELE